MDSEDTGKKIEKLKQEIKDLWKNMSDKEKKIMGNILKKHQEYVHIKTPKLDKDIIRIIEAEIKS